MPYNPVQKNKQQRSDEFEYSTIDGEQNPTPMYELSSAGGYNETGGQNMRDNTDEYENAKEEVITDDYQRPTEDHDSDLYNASLLTCRSTIMHDEKDRKDGYEAIAGKNEVEFGKSTHGVAKHAGYIPLIKKEETFLGFGRFSSKESDGAMKKSAMRGDSRPIIIGAANTGHSGQTCSNIRENKEYLELIGDE